MASLSKSQAVGVLRRLGWQSDTEEEYRQDVEEFQRGWNLGAALTVDRKVGPATSHALLVSDGRREDRQPTASAHFGFAEMKCTCGGRYFDCRTIRASRGLFAGLELTRSKVEWYRVNGLVIESGYRCPQRNRAVGGALASKHMEGIAADVRRVATVRQIVGLDVFGGVGWQDPQALVRHVDDRPVDHRNPTRWQYAV